MRARVAVLLLGVAACGGADEGPPARQGPPLSVAEEARVGVRAAPRVAARLGGYVDSEVLAFHLERVLRRIVGSSVAGRTAYPITAQAVRDSTATAVLLPGGPILVPFGLLRALETEAELAGIFAHEVGHLVGRHAARWVVAGVPVDVAADSLAAGILEARYTEEQERQADAFAVDVLADAGYDPRAYVSALEALEDPPTRGRAPGWFEIHGAGGGRIERARERIERRFPDGVPDSLGTGVRLWSARPVGAASGDAP